MALISTSAFVVGEGARMWPLFRRHCVFAGFELGCDELRESGVMSEKKIAAELNRIFEA